MSNRHRAYRVEAFKSVDSLLRLLEWLGIRSASFESLNSDMLDDYIARHEHLWNKDGESFVEKRNRRLDDRF